MKKRIVALTVSILLALIAAGVFTAIDGYTKSARTKVELQNTYRQLQVKQSELEKNKLDSVENQKKIEELTKQLQAKKDTQARILAESSVRHVEAPVIAQSDEWYRNYIFAHEGGLASVNSIGCKGLGQDCNGQLEKDCPNWANDLPCQLAFWERYMQARYGSWAKAYAFKIAKGWW